MRTLKQVAINMADAFTRFGLWKGGGSGGSSALSDMTDVTFTDLQANDVLKYNGSVWVNGDDLHEYSTEEKVVGKWIDGKPIYERVFTNLNLSLNTDDWHYTNITIDNLKYVIDSLGITDVYCQYFNPFGVWNNNNQLWWRHNKINNSINIIVVQYTKTTD